MTCGERSAAADRGTVERVGVQDTFAESGEWAELYAKYGLTKERVLEAASKVLDRSRKAES